MAIPGRNAIPRSAVLADDGGAPARVINVIQQARESAAKHPSPKIAVERGAGPDPRVADCMRKTTKVGLMTCLDELSKPQKPAPGKIGGVRPPIVCPPEAVTDWYAGPGGSNDNSCTTSGSPCDPQTWPQELALRWACGGGPERAPEIAQATLIHLTGNATQPTVPTTFKPRILGNGSFGITCVQTQTASGSLSGVTAKHNLAPAHPLTINLTSAASFVGQLLVNLTRNASSIIDAAVSTNVARLNQPLNASNQEVDTYANGDSYQIMQGAALYPLTMDPECDVEHSVSYFPVNCATRSTVQYCRVPSVAIAGGILNTSRFLHTTLLQVQEDSLTDFQSSTVIGSEVSSPPFNFQNSISLASSINGLFATGVGDQYGVYIGSDSYMHGLLIFPPGSISTYDAFWVDPGETISLDGQVFPGNLIQGDGVGFTVSNLNPAGGNTAFALQFGGFFAYNGGTPATAAQSFSDGIIFNSDMGADRFNTFDWSQNPALLYTQRALTLANFDQSIRSGGFAGIACDANLMGCFYNWGFTPPVLTPFSGQPFTAIGVWPEIPNTLLWLRGDFVTVASGVVGGALTYARDESGNNYDHSRPIGTGSTFTTFPVTGAPAMHFASGGGITPASGSSVLGLGDHSTSCVVMRSSGAGSGATIWRNGNIQILDNVASGTHWGTYVGTYLDSGVFVDDGNPHVLCLRAHTLSNVDLITDGVIANRTTGTAYQNIGVGGLADGTNYTGDIAEVGAVNADLDNQTIDDIDTYESGRYGIPITLTAAQTFAVPLGGQSGGTGLGQSGCPSGQFLGGTPYACSTPSGTGATCPINLASCVTGTLGTANIAPGATNTLLATNSSGVVGWHAVVPTASGTDVTLSGNITNGSIPWEVIGWGTIPLSGALPTQGQVYTYDSSGPIWRPNSFSAIAGAPIPVISGINHGTPANVATSYGTQFATFSLTVPSGATAVVDCTATIEWALTVTSGGHTLQYGIAQNSTAAPTTQRTIASSTTAQYGGGMVERYNGLSAGSYTYNVLAQDANNTGVGTNSIVTADLSCIQH